MRKVSVAGQRFFFVLTLFFGQTNFNWNTKSVLSTFPMTWLTVNFEWSCSCIRQIQAIVIVAIAQFEVVVIIVDEILVRYGIAQVHDRRGVRQDHLLLLLKLKKAVGCRIQFIRSDLLLLCLRWLNDNLILGTRNNSSRSNGLRWCHQSLSFDCTWLRINCWKERWGVVAGEGRKLRNWVIKQKMFPSCGKLRNGSSSKKITAKEFKQ